MKKTFFVRSSAVLDNVEADWLSHGLFPRTAPGDFEANAAHIVTRKSETELYVMNTEGDELTFVVRQ